MDGPRFDELTQRLASLRLTRGRAVRGMVGSVAALAGGVAFTGRVAAKKKPYCACPNATATCTEETGGKKTRKRYIRDHPCSYQGTCRGAGSHNPCDDAGAQITVNRTELNRIGDPCVDDTDCGGRSLGLACVALICVPIEGATLGETCNSNDDCATGRCQGGQCVLCSGVDICGPDNDARCCVANADCVRGVCLLPLNSL